MSNGLIQTRFHWTYEKHFYKSSEKDYIPLRLSLLSIDKAITERKSAIKFLAVIVDKDLIWRAHINTVETKIAKNIGLLYKARQYLNKEYLKKLCFLYIHNCSSYANIVWPSAHKAKLKRLLSQQKQTYQIIFHELRNANSQPLLK